MFSNDPNEEFGYKKGQLRFALDEELFVFGDSELTPPVLFRLPPESPIILLKFVPSITRGKS